MQTVAVGLIRDLPPKRVMRAQVHGQDLVVWRGTDGDIAAWDNRCPHRGMALSHGFVRGNDLACLYHGWHYGGSGVCRYIPAHPDLEPPATIKARIFSVAVQDGVIWVNTAGPAEPPTLPIKSRPLRNFMVDAAADAFVAAGPSVRFDGASPADLGDGLLQLGARQMLLLANPWGPDRTQITALADGAATPGQCRALSRWCEAAKRQARQPRVAA